MEFRYSNPEHRKDRRICPSCQLPSGTKPQCPRCGKETRARIQLVWFVDGHRHRQLTYCWREADAAEILRRKEEDYWRQQDLGVDREIGGSLREAYDAFTGQLGDVSDNYRKQLRTAVHALADGIGWDRPVPLIASQDLAQYREDGLTAMEPTTVRSYLLALRRFFTYLHQEGWIRRNPASKVKLPRARARTDCLRPSEVGPVLDAFYRVAPHIAPIAVTLALGGWRKGEIINLRRENIDLDTRWAYVLPYPGDEFTSPWTPKTEGSRRAIPLHPLVVQALHQVEPVARPDGQPSPWMFPITDPRKRHRFRDKRGRLQPVHGDRRSPSTTIFGDNLRKALREAGIDRNITIHGLRRTFAVLLQESGAPDAVIRQALGHRPRGVTATHYLPRRESLVQRWVDSISISLAAPPAPEPLGKTGRASTEGLRLLAVGAPEPSRENGTQGERHPMDFLH